MNTFFVTIRKIKLRRFHYINNDKMCTSTILIKVAINSLEHLTMKPVFLRNSFGVLFHITETSHRLLRSTWIKSISQFWPNIWVKNGLCSRRGSWTEWNRLEKIFLWILTDDWLLNNSYESVQPTTIHILFCADEVYLKCSLEY